MNLNEVEKHVKFDIIFQLLIYIGIGLCLILSIIVILATPAKALTSTDLTNLGIQAGQHCTNHPNNTFCAAAINQSGSGNPCGNGDARCYLAINYVYDYNVMSLNFKLNTSINADSKVTITLKGTNFDNVPYYCSMSNDSVSGCVANRTSSTSMNINFTTKSSQMVYPEFDVYTNSGFNTGKSFKITSVVLYENPVSSGGGSSGGNTIINNNFDTQEIINNNNVNAEETQNVIENGIFSIITELANRCTNLISPNLFTNGIYAENNGAFVDKSHNTTINNTNADNGSINFTTTEEWWGIANTDYIPIAPQGSYHLKFNSNLNNYMVDVFYYNSNKQYMSYSQTWNINNITFTAPVNASYVRIGFSSNNYGSFTISNLTLNANNNVFCPYGSTTSKLDDIGGVLGGIGDNINITNDKLQDEYDYLTDDSDPTVDSNGIQSTMNMVQTNNPLSYLLTLPTNLLSAIINGLSSNTCQDFEIGKFGHVGRHDLGTYTFKFPCIDIQQKIGSNLYNTIDIFVSVGILVLTIVKFYNTISNYLTLGAEDEVKAHSHFLTPMDFLGNILGGNIGGIGNSLSSMSGGL